MKAAAEQREANLAILRHLSEVAGPLTFDGEKPITEQICDYNALMDRLLTCLETWAEEKRGGLPLLSPEVARARAETDRRIREGELKVG